MPNEWSDYATVISSKYGPVGSSAQAVQACKPVAVFLGCSTLFWSVEATYCGESKSERVITQFWDVCPELPVRLLKTFFFAICY